MSTQTFTRSDEQGTAKRHGQVALMLRTLHEAEGEPVPFDEVCSEAGVKYPADVQSAMYALEIVGVVDRYVFHESGSQRAHVAYAIARDEAGELPDPS